MRKKRFIERREAAKLTLFMGWCETLISELTKFLRSMEKRNKVLSSQIVQQFCDIARKAMDSHAKTTEIRLFNSVAKFLGGITFHRSIKTRKTLRPENQAGFPPRA